MAYEGFSRKDLIKMLEEANDSIEHYVVQSEQKDEEISELNKRVEKLEFERDYGEDSDEDSDDEDITTEREREQCREYHESLKQIAEQLGGINQKNKAVTTELIKFIAGDYSSEGAVKKAIKRDYSQEFIDGNAERWAEIGLDFSEE